MTPTELQTRLQTLYSRPLQVKILDGKSTYASAIKTRTGVLRLSVHRLFLHAPTPVLEALIRFATKPDRASRAVIRQMANLYFMSIEPPQADDSLSDAKGEHIDLQELYDRTNADYFGNTLNIPIAWFPAPRYRKFRHITFGTFDRTLPLVRLNRILDHPDVPLPFVEFIVYHEMLHAVCGPRLDRGGRLCVHTAEFRREEAKHRHYLFSKEWAKKSLKFFKRLSTN